MRYRHYVDPNNMPLFRGSERIRLMTMVIMLGVVGMLVFRARDPRMWRYFAAQDETVSPKTLREFDKAQQHRLAAAAAVRKRPDDRATAKPAAASAAALGNPPVSTELALAEGEPSTSPQSSPSGETAPAAAPAKGNGSAPAEPSATPTPAPHAAPGLADDVPPPEPTVDPEYLQKIAEPARAPGSEAAAARASASENSPGAADSPGNSAAPAMVPGPAGEESANKPREPGGPETAGKKAENQLELPAIDEDPIERKDFEYECQALDDKDVLRPEEMAAYWRLVRWCEEQTFKQMDSRARRGLTLSHFFEHPSRYRGQLVRLQLRISRATAHETEENGNSLGIERVYDLWGCTDESSPNPYAVAVVHLPADFPLGHDIQEDVTFVGYFLKLMAYKSRDDKTRAAPLLVGKVVWHPVTQPVMPINMNWVWGGVVAAMVVVVLVVRMTFRMRPLRRVSMLPPLHEGEEGIPIETWLERVEDGTADPRAPEAISPPTPGEHQSNGNGNGHVLPRRLDHTEDQER